MSTFAQRAATAAHRKRSKAKGLVRIEVKVPAADAELVRRVATNLRAVGAKSRAVRRSLRSVLAESTKGSALDIYASDLPDEYFEGVFDRKRTASRPIKL
jgi:hypothetical protein